MEADLGTLLEAANAANDLEPKNEAEAVFKCAKAEPFDKAAVSEQKEFREAKYWTKLKHAVCTFAAFPELRINLQLTAAGQGEEGGAYSVLLHLQADSQTTPEGYEAHGFEVVRQLRAQLESPAALDGFKVQIKAALSDIRRKFDDAYASASLETVARFFQKYFRTKVEAETPFLGEPELLGNLCLQMLTVQGVPRRGKLALTKLDAGHARLTVRIESSKFTAVLPIRGFSESAAERALSEVAASYLAWLATSRLDRASLGQPDAPAPPTVELALSAFRQRLETLKDGQDYAVGDVSHCFSVAGETRLGRSAFLLDFVRDDERAECKDHGAVRVTPKQLSVFFGMLRTSSLSFGEFQLSDDFQASEYLLGLRRSLAPAIEAEIEKFRADEQVPRAESRSTDLKQLAEEFGRRFGAQCELSRAAPASLASCRANGELFATIDFLAPQFRVNLHLPLALRVWDFNPAKPLASEFLLQQTSPYDQLALIAPAVLEFKALVEKANKIEPAVVREEPREGVKEGQEVPLEPGLVKTQLARVDAKLLSPLQAALLEALAKHGEEPVEVPEAFYAQVTSALGAVRAFEGEPSSDQKELSEVLKGSEFQKSPLKTKLGELPKLLADLKKPAQQGQEQPVKSEPELSALETELYRRVWKFKKDEAEVEAGKRREYIRTVLPDYQNQLEAFQDQQPLLDALAAAEEPRVNELLAGRPSAFFQALMQPPEKRPAAEKALSPIEQVLLDRIVGLAGSRPSAEDPPAVRRAFITSFIPDYQEQLDQAADDDRVAEAMTGLSDPELKALQEAHKGDFVKTLLARFAEKQGAKDQGKLSAIEEALYSQAKLFKGEEPAEQPAAEKQAFIRTVLPDYPKKLAELEGRAAEILAALSKLDQPGIKELYGNHRADFFEALLSPPPSSELGEKNEQLGAEAALSPVEEVLYEQVQKFKRERRPSEPAEEKRKYIAGVLPNFRPKLAELAANQNLLPALQALDDGRIAELYGHHPTDFFETLLNAPKDLEPSNLPVSSEQKDQPTILEAALYGRLKKLNPSSSEERSAAEKRAFIERFVPGFQAQLDQQPNPQAVLNALSSATDETLAGLCAGSKERFFEALLNPGPRPGSRVDQGKATAEAELSDLEAVLFARLKEVGGREPARDSPGFKRAFIRTALPDYEAQLAAVADREAALATLTSLDRAQVQDLFTNHKQDFFAALPGLQTRLEAEARLEKDQNLSDEPLSEIERVLFDRVSRSTGRAPARDAPAAKRALILGVLPSYRAQLQAADKDARVLNALYVLDGPLVQKLLAERKDDFFVALVQAREDQLKAAGSQGPSNLEQPFSEVERLMYEQLKQLNNDQNRGESVPQKRAYIEAAVPRYADQRFAFNDDGLVLGTLPGLTAPELAELYKNHRDDFFLALARNSQKPPATKTLPKDALRAVYIAIYERLERTGSEVETFTSLDEDSMAGILQDELVLGKDFARFISAENLERVQAFVKQNGKDQIAGLLKSATDAEFESKLKMRLI